MDPEASVDPEYTTQDPDWLPIVNLQTGELLKRLEMPKTIRVSRKKMRALLAEGIEVNVSDQCPKILSFLTLLFLVWQYAKRLSEIRTTEDGQVAAYFHDGSHVTGDCLVAAEGARSVARIKLVGTDAAVIQTVPFLGSRVVFRYPSAEQALSARQLHPVQSMGIHPEGIWAFIAGQLHICNALLLSLTDRGFVRSPRCA